MSTRHLIIGANGQIGTELTHALVRQHGPDAVVTSDLAKIVRASGYSRRAISSSVPA